MKTISEELTNIITMSKKMLLEAESQNWDRVISAEKNRRAALNELFSRNITLEDKKENSDMIQEILSLNSQLEKLSATARDKLRDENSTINKGNRALGAYAQHSGA